jgi:hypothetical protein
MKTPILRVFFKNICFFVNILFRSQPLYSPPINETVSNIYYFKRDVRRDYPQTLVYTAQELKALGPGSTPLQ